MSLPLFTVVESWYLLKKSDKSDLRVKIPIIKSIENKILEWTTFQFLEFFIRKKVILVLNSTK